MSGPKSRVCGFCASVTFGFDKADFVVRTLNAALLLALVAIASTVCAAEVGECAAWPCLCKKGLCEMSRCGSGRYILTQYDRADLQFRFRYAGYERACARRVVPEFRP